MVGVLPYVRLRVCFRESRLDWLGCVVRGKRVECGGFQHKICRGEPHGEVSFSWFA